MNKKIEAVIEVLNTMQITGVDNCIKLVACVNTLKDILKEGENDGNEHKK